MKKIAQELIAIARELWDPEDYKMETEDVINEILEHIGYPDNPNRLPTSYLVRVEWDRRKGQFEITFPDEPFGKEEMQMRFIKMARYYNGYVFKAKGKDKLFFWKQK